MRRDWKYPNLAVMSNNTISHPDLLDDINAFCKARGVARSTFGMHAIGDPRLVSDLEDGRELRMKTIAAIRRYMVTGAPRSEAAQ